MRIEAKRYKWKELSYDSPMEGIGRRLITGENAMLAEITLRQGTVVPTHHHENEQFACVLSGKLRFTIGPEGSDESHDVMVGAGEVMYLPSNVHHAAEAIEDTRVIDIFSPPAPMGMDRIHTGRD